MEEGNTSRAYFVAFMVAVAFVATAFLIKFYLLGRVIDTRTPPPLGEPGSTHAHASLIIMDEDTPLSFCETKYMLRSQLVHFEDDNCTVVHKHATGVTLQTFLKSLDIALTDDCLLVPGREKRCADGTRALRVVVNGTEVSVRDLTFYELRNNDHILVNYGKEEGALLRFKYNQVPSIPVSVNEPDPNQIF